MLTLIRIDDRLIHAQVVVGWYEKCRPDRIILADDEVASDKWERRIFSSSVNPDIRVTILTVEETAVRMNAGIYDSERVLLIVRDPVQALRLYRSGLEFEEINIGGMHYSGSRELFVDKIYMNEAERQALRELVKESVTLEARALPGDDRLILNSRIV
jgi:mannose/fructose/N-acetylgalactosamine-specific phosphotransferase system component IIB